MNLKELWETLKPNHMSSPSHLVISIIEINTSIISLVIWDIREKEY